MNIRDALATFRGHRVPHMNLIGRRRWWFAMSGVFIVLSLVGLFWRGLNFSIDFKGGTLLTYQAAKPVTVAEIQGTLAQFGLPDAQVEILGSNQVNIRTAALSSLGDRADTLTTRLATQAGVSDVNQNTVGPTWGGIISRKAVTALIVFLGLVSLYIWARFELKMAAGALIALGHDLIITAGIYALVGRQVTPETVIAILTILGYSLYDTVVIFDKVKENTESSAMVARESYAGVVNMSVNQTFMRSVNTSLVVLLPIGALLAFGGTTLKDFAFALFIGVTSGAYSSIFIAAPVLALLKEREPRFQQIRARAEARAARPGLRVAPAPSAAAGSRGASASRSGSLSSPAPRVARGGEEEAAVSRPSTGGGARTATATKSGTKKKKGKSQGKPKRRRR